MTAFQLPDLVPLWDRPPDFLPQRPVSGSRHWSYRAVRADLVRVAAELDKDAGERRVALLANPELENTQATDGLHAGVQLLLPGEAAAAHRHTPSALRIGIEATDTITEVDGDEFQLGPLDVVLNPSGTWHGHAERGGSPAVWLDVVDLPLVAALGGVLFEPTRSDGGTALLDPPSIPEVVRFGWDEMEPRLSAEPAIDGVRSLAYGGGMVLPTLAVTAHAVADGAALSLPVRTCGSIVLAGRGTFARVDEAGAEQAMEEGDVIALRSWTALSLRSHSESGIVLVVDTSPALRALGLYREEVS